MASSANQQRELWLYLSITWWIGSLVAWLTAWQYPTQTFANDSQMTMAGLLVFLISAALRLPVLTVYPRTTSMEDHFVWLLIAVANLNWFGFLSLQSQSLTAVFPLAVMGVVIEFWLYHQARLQGTLYWLRTNIERYLSQLGLTSSPTLNFVSINQPCVIHADSLRGSAAQDDSTVSDWAPNNSSLFDQAGDDGSGMATEQSMIRRTVEDGIDATGGRYMAGEITLEWSKGQTIQQFVVGFVPAFQGVPQVELEIGDFDTVAQILQCTPTGLRVQIKRADDTAESTCNLSWYAKQIPIAEQVSTPTVPLP